MTSTQRSAARKLLSKVRKFEKDWAQRYLKEARLLSSGGVPLKRIRGSLNNPYGYGKVNWRGRLRGPVPYRTTRIVNKQTGRFYRGWKVRSTGNGYQVVNISTRAKYMPGTKWMKPRRVDLEARRAIRPRYNRAVRELARGIKAMVWQVILK